MKAKQKARLCENCDKIFYGCSVFFEGQFITNVCSEKCFEQNNKNLGMEEDQ